MHRDQVRGWPAVDLWMTVMALFLKHFNCSSNFVKRTRPLRNSEATEESF